MQCAGPVREARGQEAGAGLDRYDLEGGVPQRKREGFELAHEPQIDSGAADHRRHQPEIGLEFRVPPVSARIVAANRSEVQRKAGATQEHEYRRDQVDRRVIEIREARVMRRETAGRKRAECMSDRIEKAHSGEPVPGRAEEGQSRVYGPQRLGRLRDARRQLLVLHRSRCLGLVQRHAADAEYRQQRDRQHDDAHATQPLDLLAVIQDRPRQGIETDDYRGSRGREAGYSLEHRVREAERRHVGDQEWRRARESEEDPEHGNDQEAIAQPQVAAHPADREPQHEADGGDDQERGKERLPMPVSVEKRDTDRWQHRQAEDQEHQPENSLHHREIHARVPAWNSLPTSST